MIRDRYCYFVQIRTRSKGNFYANLRSRVDSELKFTLLSVVHTQSLEEKGGKSRPGTSTEGVEDKESLKSGTLVS